MSEILEKVQSIIAEKLSVDAADVTPEKSFTNDLGADSLDVIDILMTVEDEFNIEVPDEDAENVKTVAQMVDYIKEKIS